MANSPDSPSELDYADVLWQAADKLRGTVDAAEYKHVVLGLLFLKYISDSFESRRDKLKEELGKDGIKGEHLERLLEIRDEYTAERVFWVPPEARWQNLQNQATRADVATLIDDAYADRAHRGWSVITIAIRVGTATGTSAERIVIRWTGRPKGTSIGRARLVHADG